MTQVYALEEYVNEDTYIVGVYSTLERARAEMTDGQTLSVFPLDGASLEDYPGPWRVELDENGKRINDSGSLGVYRWVFDKQAREDMLHVEMWEYPDLSAPIFGASRRTNPPAGTKIATFSVWAMTVREAVAKAKAEREAMIERGEWEWPPQKISRAK